MTEDRSPAGTVRRFWAAAEARDWDSFGATLADDVVYEAPMSRERVRGREAYVRFNAEFPGDWHLTLDRVVADGTEAVSWISFTLDDETVTGLCFFTVIDGEITALHDFWPEPYEPPAGRAHLAERF